MHSISYVFERDGEWFFSVKDVDFPILELLHLAEMRGQNERAIAQGIFKKFLISKGFNFYTEQKRLQPDRYSRSGAVSFKEAAVKFLLSQGEA